MSDPVTNVEIEDVLSSIRKLVAEDSRTAPPVRKPEKPERLVLTPAQRVKNDDPAPKSSAEPVLLTQPLKRPTAPSGDLPIEEIPGDARLADFGEVEGAFPDIDRFEADEPESTTPQETHENADENTSTRSNLNRLIEQEVAAALGVAKAEEKAVPLQSLEEKAGIIRDDDRDFGWADVESDQVEPDQDVEPHQRDDEAVAPEDADIEDDLEEIEVEEPDAEMPEAFADDLEIEEDWDNEAEEAQASAAVEPEPEPVEVPAPPQTLEDKVAALGRLVARDNQEFEEERDRPDADDLAAASEPMAWPDAAPFVEVEEDEAPLHSNVLHAENAWPQAPTPQPVIEEEAEPEEEPLPSIAMAQETAPLEIDEDMLRELVGDIVRQELQGALGERITRNVRKLVRREIHRMLISQEFD